MFSGQPFSLEDLVNKIKGKEERPCLFLEYLKQRKEEIKQRVGVDITLTTHEKYERSLQYMTEFLQCCTKPKNILLVNLSKPLLEQYFQFLRKEKNIGNNTAIKYMTSLKTMLMPAISTGMIREDPFRLLKLRANVVEVGFHSDEDLQKLAEFNLNSEDLTRIRDQYLFCCYTGLAYIDLKQLGRQHFICHNEDQFYIIKPRQKTGQKSIIPLLPAARRLLQKYSLTSDFRDFEWHVSANQKMNQRLKTIGTLAGVNKTLHMHLARHTFATTVTLSNGVPLETVSKMLGHASLKQTQHYAKIVALKVINDMSLVKQLYK